MLAGAYTVALWLLVLGVVSRAAEQRRNLIHMDLALPATGLFTAGYQRALGVGHCVGAVAQLQVDYGVGISSYTVYIGYDFYSKDSFRGLWLFPHIGLRNVGDDEFSLPVVIGAGYRWQLPHGLSIGVGLGPGVEYDLAAESSHSRLDFAFLGMADFGIAFGVASRKRTEP